MNLIETCQDIAKDIYKVLGNEQDEVTYKNALEVSFILDKIGYQREKDLPIYYRGHIVGRGLADFVLYDNGTILVVEVKAAATWSLIPPPECISQLNNYMISIKTIHGLLINFPQAGTNKKNQVAVEPEFKILPDIPVA